MEASGFAAPVLFRKDGTSSVLRPVPLNGRDGGVYTEEWLKRLLFYHPETLPIAEIDDSFAGLIPLCMELDTPAGAVDAVFTTRGGRLALLETKLWRNPQARREVVGQILDYAKELTNWDYSRLDAKVRQARKALGEEFPGIAERVTALHPEVVSHRFQDAVTKSLARGDYLLLVAGDGIREGVGAIAQYLDRNSSLHFTFGLVECAVYEGDDSAFYVQPRVLAHSTKLIRTILFQGDGRILEVESDAATEEESDIRPDLAESRERYQKFWKEVLEKLRLEASQPMPQPARSTNQYFKLPKGADGWLSAYVAQSSDHAGVYVRFKRTPAGEKTYQALLHDRAAIDEALGAKAAWHTQENQNWVIVTRTFTGGLMESARADVQRWLVDNIERFVAAFRPRIEHLPRDET